MRKPKLGSWAEAGVVWEGFLREEVRADLDPRQNGTQLAGDKEREHLGET